MRQVLSERQQVEERYHDKKYRSHVSTGGYREMSAYRFFRGYRKDVKNLRVLDYGCGDGWLSIEMARKGAAEVYGIDISSELLGMASKSAAESGLGKSVHFLKMPGEDMTFPDGYFDLCVGSAILHHTEIEQAIKGIRRVLKPGGKAVFLEPMNQNLLLKTWRWCTPWRRSPAEKALLHGDLEMIRNVFPSAKFYYYALLSILSEGILLILPESRLALHFNDVLEKLDSRLLRRFPSLGKYCAIVVMELT